MPWELLELSVGEVSSVGDPATDEDFLIIKRLEGGMTLGELMRHRRQAEAMEQAWRDLEDLRAMFFQSIDSIFFAEGSESEKQRALEQTVADFLGEVQPLLNNLTDDMAAKSAEIVKSIDSLTDPHGVKDAVHALTSLLKELPMAEKDKSTETPTIESLKTQIEQLTTSLEEHVEEVKRLKALVPEDAKPKEEDVLKNLSPDVRAYVEQVKADNAALTQRLDANEAIIKAREAQIELDLCKSLAGSMPNLGISAEDIQAIRTLGLDRTASLMDRLGTLNKMMEGSVLFKQLGVTEEGSSSQSAVQEAQKRTADLVSKSQGLDYTAAMQQVFAADPELHNQYQREVTNG